MTGINPFGNYGSLYPTSTTSSSIGATTGSTTTSTTSTSSSASSSAASTSTTSSATGSTSEYERLVKTSIATIVEKFITGNLTVNDFKTWANENMRNTPKITDDGKTVNIQFTYQGKDYNISCNKKAAAYSNDQNTVHTYSAFFLKDSCQLDEVTINTYFDTVSTTDGKVSAFVIKAGFENVLLSEMKEEQDKRNAENEIKKRSTDETDNKPAFREDAATEETVVDEETIEKPGERSVTQQPIVNDEIEEISEETNTEETTTEETTEKPAERSVTQQPIVNDEIEEISEETTAEATKGGAKGDNKTEETKNEGSEKPAENPIFNKEQEVLPQNATIDAKNADGTITTTVTNALGQIESEVVRLNGRLIKETTFKYNNDGTLNESALKEYEDDGKTLKTETRTIYQNNEIVEIRIYEYKNGQCCHSSSISNPGRSDCYIEQYNGKLPRGNYKDILNANEKSYYNQLSSLPQQSFLGEAAVKAKYGETAANFLYAALRSKYAASYLGATSTLSTNSEMYKKYSNYLEQKIAKEITAEYLYTPDEVNGFFFDSKSSLAKEISNDSYFKSFVKKNLDALKKGFSAENGDKTSSINFKTGSLHLAFGTVEVIEAWMDENGKLHLMIADTYDFTGEGHGTGHGDMCAAGDALMKDGYMKPYYTLTEVVVDPKNF